jgi:hypothetical protein
MKSRFFPIILALILVLSGCAAYIPRQAAFVFDYETITLEEDTGGEQLDTFTPAEGGGFFAVFTTQDTENKTFGADLAFIDESGILRRQNIYESELKNRRFYASLWETGRKTIVTACYSLPFGNDSEMDLYFEEYDADFNLLRSKNVGKIRFTFDGGAYDGEYFYYFYDAPAFNSESTVRNADLAVYKLNERFETVEVWNPADSETNLTEIGRIVLGGDGKIYVLYTEYNSLGDDRRIKEFGSDKFVHMNGNVQPSFTSDGDENSLFYGFNNESELFGINADGSVSSIMKGDEIAMPIVTFFLSSVPKDGKRYLLSTYSHAGEETRKLELTTITAVT